MSTIRFYVYIVFISAQIFIRADMLAAQRLSADLVYADSGEAVPGYKGLSGTHEISQNTLKKRKVSVLARTNSGKSKSVSFFYNGIRRYQVENRAPYTLFGNTPDGTLAGKILEPGTHVLRVAAHTKKNAKGKVVARKRILLKVVPEQGPPASDPLPPETTPDLPKIPTPERPMWYILDKVDGGVNYSLLNRSEVHGLSIRIRWASLNPRPGVYDFTPLRKLIERARSVDKLWTLRVMAGVSAPKWIDAPYFSYNEGGQKRSFPLPWNAEHKRQFDALIYELGKSFNRDAALQMVHVSGFDQSAEMHYQKALESHPDYSIAKMAAAWNGRIDTTAAAFPNKLINLNHSPEPFSAKVLAHARTLGFRRMLFQMNALKASTNTSWAGYTRLRDLHREGAAVGFQFVGPSANQTRFGGSFESAVTKGAQAGARFYEVYQGDVAKIKALR